MIFCERAGRSDRGRGRAGAEYAAAGLAACRYRDGVQHGAADRVRHVGWLDDQGAAEGEGKP